MKGSLKSAGQATNIGYVKKNCDNIVPSQAKKDLFTLMLSQPPL